MLNNTISGFSSFVLLGLVPALILIGFVVLITLWARRFHKTGKGGKPAEESEQPVLPTVIGARVTNMRIETGIAGTKNVRHYVDFTVTFLTDDGETLEFNVPEELYTAIHTDQTGMLVYVGNTFYDFGDGEPVTAETETP